MVEEMLATRGICVTYETVRQWGKTFGKRFADQIRQRAPARGDKWHRDEVVISIAGEPHWLWRAVDQNGIVLDVPVQRRRDTRAAQRLMKRLLKSAIIPPRVMITDKLRSYGAVRAVRSRGSFEPKPSGGRSHAKLEPHRSFLLAQVAEKADITMPELAAELAAATGEKADPASLSRWIIRAGYRFKKILRASEHDRPDVKQAREEWTGVRQPNMRLEPHRLVFVDETGTTTKMTRLRGCCPKGQRLLSNAPFGH